jgi:alpha-amylase/alpha-mannosidase (GH57 family)
MINKTKLCFLWHMHQPYYKDDIKNVTVMPWVFLHAIKDYYDIPAIAAKCGIKATFNLVPSLLVQLDSYAKNSDNDIFLALLAKDEPHRIEEVLLLNRYLFAANEKNMIAPLPRFDALYQKFQKAHEGIECFETQELLDAKVLLLLAWCGERLKEESFIKGLIDRQSNYTVLQKKELIAFLRNFVGKIIPFYKTLANEGKITLATTPYAHPILPLLLDKKAALAANASTTLPKTNEDLSQLALMHAEKGLQTFQEFFGFMPNFFWPAEGSVSEATLGLFKRYGVKFVAADEEVLFKSLAGANLYENYSFEGVNIAFRDKRLSDMIGFEFSNLEPKDAAAIFLRRIKNIQNANVVSVILDGENAWEYYKNNGSDFFYALYEGLKASDFIEVSTFDELNQEAKPLQKLASGSWINGNFDIWMGHEEKNRAWELLDKTYRDFKSVENDRSDAVKQKVYNELLIASGSDWFWWYGDDHFSLFADSFDRLFRTHLINVYTLLGLKVPDELELPVKKTAQKQAVYDPSAPITIKNNTFLELIECCQIDLSASLSTMHTQLSVQKVLFGYDSEYIYFQLIFARDFDQRVVLRCDDNEFVFSDEGFLKVPLVKCADAKKGFALSLLSEDKDNIRRSLHEGSFHIKLKNFVNEWFV